MPKRIRAHVLEAYSRYILHSKFVEKGWVSWDLNPDYGEDIFIRIFKNGKATPYAFFVQAKATDHIDDLWSQDGKHLKYQIKIDHLNHWNKFWEPVVLVLCNGNPSSSVEQGKVYWVIIQDYLEKIDLEDFKKSKIVYIPVENVLDDDGLEVIAKKTESRFSRLEMEQKAVKILIEVLEEKFDLKVVEYDPEGGSFWIDKPDGTSVMSAFNEFGDLLREVEAKTNTSIEDLLMEFMKKSSQKKE